MSRIRGERRVQPLEIIESQEDPSVLFDVKEITDHPGRVPINFKRLDELNLIFFAIPDGLVGIEVKDQ